MHRIIDKIVSLVAPSICLGCGEEGDVLCDKCLEIAGEPPTSRCAGCRSLSKNSRTCTSCIGWLNVYSVFVATRYEGVYEGLVHSLKFDLKRDALKPISKMMASQIPFIGEDILVCPLPTASSRIRQRGFDHSVMLAKNVMDELFKESVYSSWTLKNVVGGKTNTRQVGSSRNQRISQMKQEFYVKNNVNIEGQTVLLMDDVMTTGASLSAAARVLKDAGAKRVYGVIFAQK